jgi:hypothetical protein
MKSPASPGWLRRTWTAVGVALKGGLLGKSSGAYMKQFTRGDNDWDNGRAATRGSEQPTGTPDPPPAYEPVHGWTQRQLDDYLARNAAYRPIYEAELEKRKRA